MSIHHRGRHRGRTNRRRLLATSLAFAVAMLAAGCDSTSDAIQDAASSGPSVEDEPHEALREAVASLADWQGIEAAFRFEPDDAFRAGSLVDGDLDQREAELLFGSSAVMRATGLDDPEEGAFETSIIVDGTPVFDLRVTGEERIFVRFDAETLSTLSADTDRGDIDDLVVAARMFGLGDVAQAAFDGRWVELIGIDDVRELAGAGEVDEPEVDEQDLDALATRLAASIERFVDDDVAVSHVGSDDVGDRVRVTTDGASLEAFLEELTTEFDRAGLVDGLATDELDELDIEDDLIVSIDAWIDGGELRQIALDVAGLDDESSGELLIVVAMEEFTGSIAEPDDVEPLDLLGLAGAFSAGMGGDLFGGDDFGDFEEFDDELFEDFDRDEPFAELDDDLVDSDGAPDCITQQELDLIEEFEGPDALDELEELFDAGIIERC